MSSPDLRQQFVDAMRRLAATVCVLTCRDDEGECFGMTATSVASVSLEPPSLLACVNLGTEFHTRLGSAAAFCVNILSEDQPDHSRIFGSSSLKHRRFLDQEWLADGDTGAPLLQGAQASIVCTLDASLRYGTHDIVIGKVRTVVLHDTVQPLIWLDRNFVSSRGC